MLYEDSPYDSYGTAETEEERRRRQQQIQSGLSQTEGQVAQQSGVPPDQPQGSQAPQGQQPQPQGPTTTAGGVEGLGQYASKLLGWDSAKLASPHDSPKYQIGRTLSGFDPTQGVTPDVLAALNKLNLGTFSGQGDELSVANGDPRFEGLNRWDAVAGFKDPNGARGWQFGVDSNLEQAAPTGSAQQSSFAAPQAGGNALASVLQSQFTSQKANQDALAAKVAGISDLPEYSPYQFSQFGYQDDPGITSKYKSVIDQILSNPVISDAQTAALKEKQKEAALQMEADQLGGSTQDAIRRGVYGTSGAAEATQRGIRERTISDILGNYRDIDLNAADINRQGQERGAGLAEQFLGGASGRAMGQFGATLQGQAAQAGENQAGYGSKVDNIKFQLQKALAEHGINIDNEQLNQAAQRLAESGREFNANFGLDQQRMAEMIRQFNSQMGFNYNQLGQNSRQAMINQILGA